MQISWSIAAAGAVVAALAALADRRRAKRRDMDAVGWMPWPLVLIVALLVAAIGAAIALKGG